MASSVDKNYPLFPGDFEENDRIMLMAVYNIRPKIHPSDDHLPHQEALRIISKLLRLNTIGFHPNGAPYLTGRGHAVLNALLHNGQTEGEIKCPPMPTMKFSPEDIRQCHEIIAKYIANELFGWPSITYQCSGAGVGATVDQTLQELYAACRKGPC